MNLFSSLESLLFIVSNALFFPVVAGLIVLLFWIALYFGGFVREWVERRHGASAAVRRHRQTLEAEAQARNGAAADVDLRLEAALRTAEAELVRSLDRIRFVIRVGPSLGLMGTLIPMGVALAAMAQGDMPRMAGNMVTAFTTTVVGLACGIAAYLITIGKEKWVRADLFELQLTAERLLRQARVATPATPAASREVQDALR
jgi:biopolymer transport protein ExbB/TolQ